LIHSLCQPERTFFLGYSVRQVGRIFSETPVDDSAEAFVRWIVYSPEMSIHQRTNREVEVKLLVPDAAAMLRKLATLGARCERRVLERNTLYDTPDSDFRRRNTLLRIRVETPAPRTSAQLPKTTHGASPIRRTILTSKAPAVLHTSRDRHYKEKLERELVVPGSRTRWDRKLCSLGLRPGFRYDKIRSTFRLRRHPGLAIELDETPAGTFLELEGFPPDIDRAARALGYSSRDYYRGTYWDVYVANCRRRGLTPRNMLFHKQK
jgi:adenylate cyclase class IV